MDTSDRCQIYAPPNPAHYALPNPLPAWPVNRRPSDYASVGRTPSNRYVLPTDRYTLTCAGVGTGLSTTCLRLNAYRIGHHFGHQRYASFVSELQAVYAHTSRTSCPFGHKIVLVQAISLLVSSPPVMTCAASLHWSPSRLSEWSISAGLRRSRMQPASVSARPRLRSASRNRTRPPSDEISHHRRRHSPSCVERLADRSAEGYGRSWRVWRFRRSGRKTRRQRMSTRWQRLTLHPPLQNHTRR